MSIGGPRDAQTDTEKAFEAWMEKLAHAFRTEVKAGTMRVYWEALNRYPTEKLNVAFQQAVENDFRFPTIADIRKYIEPLHQSPTRRVEDDYQDLTKLRRK